MAMRCDERGPHGNATEQSCCPRDMAVIVNYRDYKSGGYPLTGHSAVLLWNGTTGEAVAYDFLPDELVGFGQIRRFPQKGFLPVPASSQTCLPQCAALRDFMARMRGIMGTRGGTPSIDIQGMYGCESVGHFAAVTALYDQRREQYRQEVRRRAALPPGDRPVGGEAPLLQYKTAPNFDGAPYYNCLSFALEAANSLLLEGLIITPDTLHQPRSHEQYIRDREMIRGFNVAEQGLGAIQCPSCCAR